LLAELIESTIQLSLVVTEVTNVEEVIEDVKNGPFRLLADTCYLYDYRGVIKREKERVVGKSSESYGR
jgi:hypothetical protein